MRRAFRASTGPTHWAHRCRQVTLLVLLGGTPAFGRVEVNVTRVGYPTLRSGTVVRHGGWAPVIVDLALLDQPSFDGTLRVAQLDGDGDQCYDAVEVHLRAESGGTQRHVLFVLPNRLHAQRAPGVEIFDVEGEAVQVLSQGVLTRRAEPAQAPFVIDDDDVMILSVSSGTIGRIADLVDSVHAETFARELHVGHVSPVDLPELWIGLDPVDIIVWDEARPEDLTARQLEALLEWVRQGGTLLLAASRTAGSLALTDALDAVLPVDIGDVTALRDLDVRYSLVGPVGEDDDPDAGFPSPVPVVRTTLREGAEWAEDTDGDGPYVVSRRRVGCGHVIFCAVTLRDLFSAPGGAFDFFRKLFHLQVLDEQEQSRNHPEPVSLFGHVVNAVSFSTRASLYLFVAGIASVAYALLATFGSWGFLRHRRWTHHSWSVFALVALAASGLSVAAVQSLRGFGETLHQISVVDADAGTPLGRATVLFGLKTASDKRVDVWLPRDPLTAAEPVATDTYLRPVPARSDLGAAATSFADPEEYRLVPGSAWIDDVRIRATLKQFEGRWSGPLAGRVTGQIRVRGSKILDGSYLANDLGVTLRHCLLLHPTEDIEDVKGDRGEQIFCYAIGDVPAGGHRVDLAAACYRPNDGRKESQVMLDSRLGRRHAEWSDRFRRVLADFDAGGGDTGYRLGDEQNALLLASTLGELNPLTLAGTVQQMWGVKTWSRDRLRRLDLREQLTRNAVVLIGFADDPGPMRLFRREGDREFRMLEPDPRKSRTMYRVRIPVTLVGRSGRAEPEDDELESLGGGAE